MFHCEDKVVYGNYGVCVVSKVNELMALGGQERPYYVLTPLRERGGTVYVPTDREELIRPIMSRSEAAALLNRIGAIETDSFTNSNSHSVEDHFKQILREGSCEAAVCVARSMQERIKEQEAKKHLPSSMYTRLHDQALRQLRSELSAALEITEEELAPLLEAQGLHAS